MSPSWLYRGWKMVLARRKAVATQENLVPRSSASEIVGSAVLVTLPSSAESRRGMQMAMKDRQKPVPRVHTCEGVSEGREGGSFGRVGFSSLEEGREGGEFCTSGFLVITRGEGGFVRTRHFVFVGKCMG
jgi:hypothetical protein